MHVRRLSKNNKKHKIIVTWWRYECCLTNDHSPSREMLRYLTALLFMTIRWPTSVPLHPKIRVLSNQWWDRNIKGRKKWTKDFWVGITFLVACSQSISKIKYLFKTHQTLSKHEIFSKSPTLCMNSYRDENHYKVFLNEGAFQKCFQTIIKHILNKAF